MNILFAVKYEVLRDVEVKSESSIGCLTFGPKCSMMVNSGSAQWRSNDPPTGSLLNSQMVDLQRPPAVDFY